MMYFPIEETTYQINAMKIVGKISLFILSLVLLASCSSTNDVATNGLIQKRKHRSGYHLNLGTNKASDRTQLADRTGSGLEQMKRGAELSELNIESERESKLVLPKGKKPKKGRGLIKRWVEQKVEKAERIAGKQVEKIRATTNVVPSESIKRLFPDEEGEESDDIKQKATIALVAGILTWLLSIGSIAVAILFPPVGLLFSGAALVSAIVAVVFGNKSKNESDLGTVGFILGLVYLILTGIALLITILLFILFIVAISA